MNRGTLPVLFQAFIVVAAGIVFAVHPSERWVETAFINGYYPGLENALGRLSGSVPFPLGDWVVLAGIALVLVRAVVWWRRAGSRRTRAMRYGLETACICAFYAVAFYAAWGWCYDRGPLVERVNFDPSRITAASVTALRSRAIEQVNYLAPLAHRSARTTQFNPLERDVMRIVEALGNHGSLYLEPPKRSLIDFYLTATGIGGYINPYSAEDIAASDVLWFERPDFTAHEWAHLSGFAREDEANYIAVLACLRSTDIVAQYSGWLELYFYLYDPSQKLTRKTFGPEVWQDIAAVRDRNQSHVNVDLSKLQWHLYNRYLQANHVKSGTVSYSQFVQLLIGVGRGADGLPLRTEK